jgi:hypothetical protein
MKRILLLLAILISTQVNAQVVINEVDCDQVGTDAAEFIELIGEPNTSLDGLVVVCFNGSSDLSYAAYDLDGFSTDANGLFVLGNAGVNGVQIEFGGNSLQNGADAIVIYVGDAASWPIDTPVSSANLVDAVVYGTSDPDDTGLLDAFTPGQPQVDEGANMNQTAHSISRIPDGGDAFNSSVYVAQDPTPGAFNASAAPLCVAGTVAGTDALTSFTTCTNTDEDPILFSYDSTLPATNYWYVIVDADGNIVALSEVAQFDFDMVGAGEYSVYGFTFSGNLDPSTTTVGLPVTGLMSDDCFDLSSNSISVSNIDCSLPTCVGGTLSSASSNYVFCDTEVNSLVNVSIIDNVTDAGQVTVSYLTDNNNLIVAALEGETINMNSYGVGSYRIWGITYFPNLDPTTLEVGDDLTQVTTDGACLAFTSNYIAIEIVECNFENPCQSLIISEYFEGSSFNKVIELYNTSNFPIDLDAYELFLYANGAVDYTQVFAPQGILQGGETFVIVHPSADAEVLALADTTSNVTNFNGDDALVLTEDLVAIDVIGEVGIDPGTTWPVGSGSTANFSLVRYNYVTSGNASWAVCQNQYMAGSSDSYSTIGNHDFIPCSTIPQIGFVVNAISVSEDVTTVEVGIQAYNIANAVNVEVNFVDGTAISPDDYINDGPVAVSFPAGNSVQFVTVQIVNDEIEEDAVEYFTLLLSSLEEVDFISSEMTVSIEPNDQSYPVLSIEEAASTNADGILNNLDLFCELRGVVQTINFNASGVHFHIFDPTDGIKVFKADNNLGYTVQEGDSVHVGGYLTQFNGQAEIRPDYITLIDGGHDMETPVVVTSLSEENESHLVTFECVFISNPGSWTNFGSSFTVNVADGVNSIPMLIDGDTELFPADLIEGHFTVTGIVEQNDMSSPFDSDYVIMPRYFEDITNQVVAAFELPSTIQFGDNGTTVDVTNSSSGATSYEWNFGDGNTATGEVSTIDYTYEFLSDVADVTVTLTATSATGCVDITTNTVDVSYVGVDELNDISIIAYPNPTKENLVISSAKVISSIQIFDGVGRCVYSDMNVNSVQLNIALASFEAGVYTALIKGDNFSSEIRLIKE